MEEEAFREDTSYLLERALEIWKSTDGCFEIGIYPLMQEWGFTRRQL